MRLIFTLLLVFILSFSFAQTTTNFENFNLNVGEALNGSVNTGGFNSGNIFLPNSYNAGYNSWSGWAISSMTDVSTPGYTNDFSAITGGGHDNSTTYATSFVVGESRLILENAAAGKQIFGFYITNGTYPYLSMKDGDLFAKKFGGVTGNDPDYFLLTIKKYLNGSLSTDSIDFYLADYRFTDNTQDYIIDEWTYIDLTSLGDVDSLSFTLSSTDNGMFGMNTPAYFCIDNLTTSDGTTSTFGIQDENLFDIFPNPTSDFIFIKNKSNQELNTSIFNINGIEIYNNIHTKNKTSINIEHLPKGTYIIKVQTDSKFSTQYFIKQ